MKRPDNRAFEQAPHPFDAVSVNISVNPFLFRVVDGFVAGIVIGNADIGFKFVRVDSFGFILYRSSDKVMDGFLLDVRNLLNTNFSTSLDSSPRGLRRGESEKAIYIIRKRARLPSGSLPRGPRFLRYCFLYSHLQRFCLMCATTLSMSSGLIIPAQAVIIGDLPTAAPPFVITFTRYSSV